MLINERKFEEQNVPGVSKYFPTKYSVVRMEKRVREKRPGRSHLNQVITVDIIGNRAN